MCFHGLPYSELIRCTLISSPFIAFATSIFFDQLPPFSSITSLENKQHMLAFHILASFTKGESQDMVFYPHVSFCRKTTLLSASPMTTEAWWWSWAALLVSSCAWFLRLTLSTISAVVLLYLGSYKSQQLYRNMIQNIHGNKHLNVLIWVKTGKILKTISNKSQENINNLNARPSAS